MFSQQKTIDQLKKLVANKMKKRKLDEEKNWQVTAISISDSDPNFSEWLLMAASHYQALKKRSRFTVKI